MRIGVCTVFCLAGVAGCGTTPVYRDPKYMAHPVPVIVDARTRRPAPARVSEEDVMAIAYTARELNEREQVAHVLSRLTFGARPGDAERMAAIGVDRWILQQLVTDSAPEAPLAGAMRSIPAWKQPPGTPLLAPSFRFVSAKNPPGNTPAQRMAARDSINRMNMAAQASMRAVLQPSAQVAAGKVIHAQLSEYQLAEVIADFWENHFSVYTGKQPGQDAIPLLWRGAIRPRALGRFRDLLGAVAHTPAMLFYLDNWLSRKDKLNENYARELMELHTLGVDGGYTQADVIAVARALTGWTTSDGTPYGAPRSFVFDASAHDDGTKMVLGHTLAPGRGVEDGEEVLDILARHPSTAHYISLKLARRLVSDDPPAALVDRAAAEFARTDGDIAATVRIIVTSAEFFSRDAFRAKVKTPFELVVSARRAVGAPADTTSETPRLLTELNHTVAGRVTPDGWPDYSAAWLNSGSVMKRVLFAADVAEGKLAYLPVSQWPGWTTLANASAKDQADGIVRLIFGGVAQEETRTALANVTETGPARLTAMLAVALGSPEFQRR